MPQYLGLGKQAIEARVIGLIAPIDLQAMAIESGELPLPSGSGGVMEENLHVSGAHLVEIIFPRQRRCVATAPPGLPRLQRCAGPHSISPFAPSERRNRP